jgi:hypothetical protein
MLIAALCACNGLYLRHLRLRAIRPCAPHSLARTFGVLGNITEIESVEGESEMEKKRRHKHVV